ncbi:MAG TPA: SMP-30/gluconolactonase/LRE family protein, partial [Terriglobia bacterium]|nr:SMP-30/gluconolactonase/LRE family protein [Terriglobia bacterium]
LGPDSQRQPGVPVGTVTQYTWTSKIFPGTVRDYWVYVPTEYNAQKPACVMVVQDGAGFIRDTGASRMPIVFDNLIYKHEMPVTIGIFINPGVLPAPQSSQRARYDRSFEYDALGGRYARFLLDEILPEVGKHYNLSTNPNDRAIAGISSGGIAAFTVAWTHPEAFRRVLSFVGSFTDLRGGDIYPALIRKTEPKPLRVFLQDGTRDLNIYAGNWYINAQSMASALEFSGYDVKFVAGTEDHNMKQGGAILPDALRWLWRGYPAPITAPGTSGDRQFSTLILAPGEGWHIASQDYAAASGLATDDQGNVFFVNGARNRIFKIAADVGVTTFTQNARGVSALASGLGGQLYACQPDRKRIVAYAPAGGAERVIAKGIACGSLAVTHNGAIYFVGNHQMGVIDTHGKKSFLDESIGNPTAVELSPDQSLLLVDDAGTKWVWSFQIQPDGSLADGEPFYRLETLDESSATGSAGMTVDSEGYLYVTTRLGIEVCDQPGRVVAILNAPGSGSSSSIVFGGPDLQTLYVEAGGKVYRRRLRRTGVRAGTLLTPPVPQL